MNLLPGWAERLGQLDLESAAPAPRVRIPRHPSFYAGRTTFVATAESAEAMAELAHQRPLSWIGLDSEFRYDRPGVVVDRGHTAFDPRSVRPLLLSLALAEPDDRGGATLTKFVVDMRRPEVLDAVRSVLSLPCPFVAHFAQAELYCLWQLGLPEPGEIWDSWVCEKAMHLGRYHKRYDSPPGATEAEEIAAKEEAERNDRTRNTLAATCRRHGVEYPFEGDKERLRRSFLDHPDDAPFTTEQIEYAAADAVAAARLYLPQLLAAARGGVLRHLETIEMPWVTTNARMSWVGCKKDEEKCRQVEAACERHLAELLPRLAAEGVTNVKSPKQLKKFFAKHGLLPLFRRGGGYSFERKQLEAYQHRHPAIALIRCTRRVLDPRSGRILGDEFGGADGRVHPEYRQLGTHTGRQSSRYPNVLGLGRVFRPLIVPEPGRGLGEVDLSQIEIGIAGAVYGDEKLIEMFNTGDVYSAMAQDFYRDQIREEDRLLGGLEFKREHRQLRDRMKACTLGIVYGMTARGLALSLGIPVAEADRLLSRFMGMFPTLAVALADTVSFGSVRGYVATRSGLRRYRACPSDRPSSWERNWMTNHPVQGSACVVFKAAGNRLDRLYRRFDAWLIVALHDAFVYEAPLEVLGEVGGLTRRVMCETVAEHFPVLRPEAEINDQRYECWNKDGHADSIERWMQDPMYSC